MRLFVLVFVVACGAEPALETNCVNEFYADVDGDGHGDPETTTTGCVAPDGYETTHDDCNDGNSDIHPDAQELCNGLDDDCDGVVDPVRPWYVDEDGDGYGSVEKSCDPLTSAAVGGDCKDHDAAVNPDAVEVCNGVDDDCDGTDDEDAVDAPERYWDDDGDGYAGPEEYTECEPLPGGEATVATDCDDTDPAVNPEALETCDGIDDDCDTLVDDQDDSLEAATQYADADGDGYGDDTTATKKCDSIGWVYDAQDCDDTSAAVNHGATEVCNKIDDDCDGYVDDQDESVEGKRTFYYDYDGDGLGTDTVPPLYYCYAQKGYTAENDGDCDDGNADLGPWTTMYRDEDHDGYGGFASVRCAMPDTECLRGGDCDDTRRYVRPGVTEVCDGIDDNCDHLVDADDPTEVSTFYADDDDDGYGGVAVAFKRKCEAPSGYVASHDDCDDAVATTNPGAPELCVNSMDDDCDHVIDPCAVSLQDADWSLIGPKAKSAATRGFTVLATDLNDDDVADLVVTAPDLDPPVYVYFGPRTGSSELENADLTFSSVGASSLAGGMGAADVDRDGWTDLLLGAPDDHVAYLFLGPVSSTDDPTADTEFLVPDHGPSATVATIVPDFDGDGSPDVVVNAIDLDDAALEGTVYVAPASTDTTKPLSLPKNATYIYEGAPSDEFGASVVPIGDVTGDGIDDLAVGATGPYAVFVLPGGEAAGAYTMLDAAVGRLCSIREDGFGYSIAATDADGDGSADLFVGAPDDGGSVYGFLAPLTGDIPRNTGDAYVHWVGTQGLGYSVAAGGDVDVDGVPDVLIGAYNSDHHRGHAYLSLRGAEGRVDVADLLSFDSAMDGNATGYAVAFVPNWSGVGNTDVAFGEPFFSRDDASGEDASGEARVDVVFSENLY